MSEGKYTRAMKFIMGDDYKTPAAPKDGARAGAANDGPSKVVDAVSTGWPTQYCPACRRVLYELGETELPVVGKCCHCGTFIEHSSATGRYEIPSANVPVSHGGDTQPKETK